MANTTRRRGQMTQTTPGTWVLRVFLGRDEAGKRRYSAKTFEGTTSQARNELAAMSRSQDTRTFVHPSKLLLGEYLDQWLAGRIDLTLMSHAQYKWQLKQYSAPIRHIKLVDVTRETIQGVLNDMYQKQGLSWSTLRYFRSILRKAFSDAQTREPPLLVTNPAEHTKLPPKVKRAATVFSMEQVHLFLEGTKDSRYHAFWTLQFTSGFRPQEAYALKWSDVDFDAKMVSVQRVLRAQGDGTFKLVEATKTKGSTRRIGIPASTIEILKTHRKAQKVAWLKFGANYNRVDDLVFGNRLGDALEPSSVRRAFIAACERLGLPKIRHYDTRHTHFTALLDNKADIAWISKRAGHSDISTTAQHYAHVTPEAHREMGEMTERMMQRAKQV